MSYIRCLSNPEGLYIWADVDGYVNICHKKNIGAPHLIPTKIFDGIIKKYRNYWFTYKNGQEYFEYKGAKLSTGSNKNNFRYVLSYGDWSVTIWEVTWEHIARDRTLSYKLQKQNKLIKKLKARIKELE